MSEPNSELAKLLAKARTNDGKVGEEAELDLRLGKGTQANISKK